MTAARVLGFRSLRPRPGRVPVVLDSGEASPQRWRGLTWSYGQIRTDSVRRVRGCRGCRSEVGRRQASQGPGGLRAAGAVRVGSGASAPISRLFSTISRWLTLRSACRTGCLGRVSPAASPSGSSRSVPTWVANQGWDEPFGAHPPGAIDQARPAFGPRRAARLESITARDQSSCLAARSLASNTTPHPPRHRDRIETVATPTPTALTYDAWSGTGRGSSPV